MFLSYYNDSFTQGGSFWAAILAAVTCCIISSSHSCGFMDVTSQSLLEEKKSLTTYFLLPWLLQSFCFLFWNVLWALSVGINCNYINWVWMPCNKLVSIFWLVVDSCHTLIQLPKKLFAWWIRSISVLIFYLTVGTNLLHELCIKDVNKGLNVSVEQPITNQSNNSTKAQMDQCIF